MVTVIIVAILWVVLFELNTLLFSSSISPYISFIFLPAGVRLIAVLLLKELGVIGLFLGALVTSFVNFSTARTVDIVLLSLISALNPYIAITFSKYCLKVDDVLSNLKVHQLFIISFIYALLNSLTHNLYFHFTIAKHDDLVFFIGMMTGDLLGCLIILYLLSLTLRIKKRRIDSHA